MTGPAGCYARSGRGPAKPASKRDGELLHREGARPLRVIFPVPRDAQSRQLNSEELSNLLQRYELVVSHERDRDQKGGGSPAGTPIALSFQVSRARVSPERVRITLSKY